MPSSGKHRVNAVALGVIVDLDGHGGNGLSAPDTGEDYEEAGQESW
jgi:hypothetical protein